LDADRTIEQWRMLLPAPACSPHGSFRRDTWERLVAATRLWSDHAHEAKLYDVVVAKDLTNFGIASELVEVGVRHPWVGMSIGSCWKPATRPTSIPLWLPACQELDGIHLRVKTAELKARGLR